MNNPKYILPKIIRKISFEIFPSFNHTGRYYLNSNIDYSNKLIHAYLTNEAPCMIARFGANELVSTVNYLSIKNKSSFFKYITGQMGPWWWDEGANKALVEVAGFFPNDTQEISKFCELMLNDVKYVDILGSWLKEEYYIDNLIENAKKVQLEHLEPFFCKNPWTSALEGKKVLVVHPFSETIKSQYKKRELLFNGNILPEFELLTIKAIQSAGYESSKFKKWFDAFDCMKKSINETDFDICIIGCGAYGFPLAAHVKRIGKKAVHLGGVTQLLFGIIGKRWENYPRISYNALFNEHWARPALNEKPKNASIIEGETYW